jgi:hypothetical protein
MDFIDYIKNDINADREILREDPFLIVLFVPGFLMTLSGAIILGAPSPNLSISFPAFAIGIAVLFYCLNRYYNIKYGKKLDEMNKTLNIISEKLNKISEKQNKIDEIEDDVQN